MTPSLPGVLDRFFICESVGDVEGLAACFTPDGAVRDEGQTHRGSRSIGDWMAGAKAKYHHSVLPVALETRDGRTIVTAEVSGDFPGSPVKLAHAFRLDGDKIATLEIG